MALLLEQIGSVGQQGLDPISRLVYTLLFIRRGLHDSRVELLHKPFTADMLADEARSALDAGPRQLDSHPPPL